MTTIPINILQPFSFLPPDIKIHEVSTNLEQGYADVYFELRDDTENENLIYKEFTYKGKVRLPLSIVSSLHDDGKLNIAVANAILNGFGMEAKTGE